MRLFPELSGGLHLDRYARILAVNDAPGEGGICERFRPRYAVDLEILTPDGARDEDFPIYEAVPLPVAMGCGHEAGALAFPERGALVVVGWAYGRPDHPIVRQVYPLGLSLPLLREGEQVWQQDARVLQGVDQNGNWRRTTDNGITDESLTRLVRALEAVAELGSEVRTVDENSTETVGGVKRIEAMGALKLLAGGLVNLSAGGNLNLTTASDRADITARNTNQVTGGNKVSEVRGNRQATVGGAMSETITQGRTETVGGAKDVTVGGTMAETVTGARTATVGGDSTETVTGDKTVVAANATITGQEQVKLQGPSIKIGNGGSDVLQIIIQFMEEVRNALNTLSTHTHDDGVIQVHDQAEPVAQRRDAVDALKTELQGLSG